MAGPPDDYTMVRWCTIINDHDDDGQAAAAPTGRAAVDMCATALLM